VNSEEGRVNIKSQSTKTSIDHPVATLRGTATLPTSRI
jgi:hypothetical protein